MIKTLKTWQLINKSLDEGKPVMLLYVLTSSGSSPGRQGFCMCVNVAGEMEGSIGGGIMEHKFVEMAKSKLIRENRAGERGHTIKKQIHDKSAARNQSGMICSGEQTILLYEVQAKDQTSIKNLIASIEKHENGTLTLSPNGIGFNPEMPVRDFDYSFHSAEEWFYLEKTGYRNKLFIIGGGHCALALSELMSSMDFYIHVIDDRKGLNTMMANEAAHQKHIVADYAELRDLVEAGDHHYVVIMTLGYRSDDIALRALIGKEFKYLGLLGSATKVQTMVDDYRKEGISESWLQRIHTPIGLLIKSQTPEEIAVSIAAEIIRTKNQDL